MDDYTLASLTESKNIWCMTLLKTLTPCIVDGFKSIFNESVNVCNSSKEPDKYLMTMQTFLSRIPNWNQNIIDKEKDRIVEHSKCSYIDEMISCVHIVHLKALTCIRAGKKQKQIDIDIPNLSKFIHMVYIHTARKLYNSIYLFEVGIPSLDTQRNYTDIDNIVKSSILETINESIPIENLLRAYLEKDEEEEYEPNLDDSNVENDKNNKSDTPNLIEDAVTQDITPSLDTNPVKVEVNDTDNEVKSTELTISNVSNEQSVDGTVKEVETITEKPHVPEDPDDLSDSEFNISIGDNISMPLDDIEYVTDNLAPDEVTLDLLDIEEL